jgi:carbamoyl-phosphate synthase small subunit
VTHRNLNDDTVEGVRHVELPAFGVQYHPEASPGPHDARMHFAEFVQALDSQ